MKSAFQNFLFTAEHAEIAEKTTELNDGSATSALSAVSHEMGSK
jgi:hypothetical protein